MKLKLRNKRIRRRLKHANVINDDAGLYVIILLNFLIDDDGWWRWWWLQ
jgi:hypothetical protein